MEDLWPEDLTVKEMIQAPVKIVQEQGAILGDKTNNILYGKIGTFENNKYDFSYSFHIVCPTISYSYKLFEFQYSLKMYPVRITSEPEVFGSSPTTSTARRTLLARSETTFKKALKQIFNSTKSKRIINTLLAQADANLT